MARQRVILEMGTGNDLYGEDYTKAAKRAVDDALHHSSLILFRSLDIDRNSMQIELTIGVQKPEAIVPAEVVAGIPYGAVNVSSVCGGLNVVDDENGTVSVIATAAIAVYLDLPDGRFTLAQ